MKKNQQPYCFENDSECTFIFIPERPDFDYKFRPCIKRLHITSTILHIYAAALNFPIAIRPLAPRAAVWRQSITSDSAHHLIRRTCHKFGLQIL